METEEERLNRLDKEAERIIFNRSLETEDQKKRLEKEASRYRIIKNNKTKEQHILCLDNQVVRKRVSRQKNTIKPKNFFCKARQRSSKCCTYKRNDQRS